MLERALPPMVPSRATRDVVSRAPLGGIDLSFLRPRNVSRRRDPVTGRPMPGVYGSEQTYFRGTSRSTLLARSLPYDVR